MLVIRGNIWNQIYRQELDVKTKSFITKQADKIQDTLQNQGKQSIQSIHKAGIKVKVQNKCLNKNNMHDKQKLGMNW